MYALVAFLTVLTKRLTRSNIRREGYTGMRSVVAGKAAWQEREATEHSVFAVVKQSAHRK